MREFSHAEVVMDRIADLWRATVFLLALSSALRCSAEPPPPSIPDFFYAPIDLALVKAGDWLEYSGEWKCGNQVRATKERIACVRASETEVWIERGDPRWPGLFRVERKSRKIKAAWQTERDGTITEMIILEPPQLPVPEMKVTAKVIKAVAESGTREVGKQKLETSNIEIEADCKKGGSIYRSKLSLSLSKDLPLPIPSKGDARLGPPVDSLALLASAAEWKTPPSLEGTIVSYVIVREDPAGVELTVTDSGNLQAYGTDAKPSVVVEGETDK